jgi:membrane fusion protein (multidrug efflux system)
VVVVDETNKAVAVPIKTGGMSGLNFVVTEGLKGGERIIVNGLQKARPGTPVRMIMLGPDGKPLPAKVPDPAAPTSSSSSTKETPPATEQTPPANKETSPTPPAKGPAETNVEQKK